MNLVMFRMPPCNITVQKWIFAR